MEPHDVNAPFYEQARDLGEVVWRGLRYRLFYEPQRQCTICVLVPGQNLALATNN